MADKNEFEELEGSDKAPEQEFSEVPGGKQQENMISSGSAGTVYDWTKAPEGVKAPPRIDLDGKEIVLKKADIIMPSRERDWEKTKAGDKEFKYCTFVLHFDIDGQQEFYSGVRTFKKDEKDPDGYNKYSHPTITRDRNNQASRLLGLYADYKEKDINEIPLKEFLFFLNSKPKIKISSQEVTNPTTGKTIKKNFVGEFLK